MDISTQKLLDSALKILSLRPHSKQEVINFLRRKTEDATLINQTVAKLEKAKLIDDEAFAKWYIESRSRTRPRGSRLLALELKQKGINISTSHLELSTETELAGQALEKKKNIKSCEQAIRFLQYRGFSWDAIEKVVRKRYN